ncbi:chaperonin 10-like protein [Fomitopsis serialis]|uniref:chaperonin 10-like protein n=1 Tax=Fomitopsis serialis TaxID=139415 RepID=UPI0020072C39|nr:chaperonin 10-like protein [Neoantrodia serialis]KAH9919380.1 chaperonin 10-like protein [Neoantrodia serialis]
MSQQKVVHLLSKHGPFAVASAPVPKPGPGEVLIKVQSTALNPVDWKIPAWGIFIEHFPAILGGDAAGNVEEVGEGVTNLKKGDRVCAADKRSVNEHSTFQQYKLGYANATGKIPDNLSFDQAATIPLGLATAAIGLFHEGAVTGSVGLFPPWEDGGRALYAGEPIVVVGGASSVGQYVIQLAKLAGFRPIIATASLHNAEYLKNLGATHVLDRNLPDATLIAEVKKITLAPIRVVFDAISESETQNVAYAIVASGGTLVLVLPSAIENKTDDKRIVYPYGNTNVPGNRRLGASLYSKITVLLEEGVVKPNPVEVLPNGLEGIIAGLEKLKQGVSNVKLVGHPQETV